MIPGTAKETAALAMIRMKAAIGYASTGEIARYEQTLKAAERRESVAAGLLPGSSRFVHKVPLGVDMVVEAASDGCFAAYLTYPVQRALRDTAIGAHELWFTVTGDAVLSFELEGDAILFRLALDA